MSLPVLADIVAVADEDSGQDRIRVVRSIASIASAVLLHHLSASLSGMSRYG
jgi:hypothetical protein